MKRELWSRMVFNAICGNGDDHPRNHGFIFQEKCWRLAPAFDIAPYITYSGVHSMAITRSGYSEATRHNLLADCGSFGWVRNDAESFINSAIELFTYHWHKITKQCGFSEYALPVRAPTWLG